MKHLFYKYRHIWVLSYAFIYLPWFIYLEKTVTKNYHVMYTRLDDFIPFNEYFIVPYLLWFIYVSVAIIYFFFHSKEDYYRLCTFLFTGMTISLLICTLFPNGTNFRPVIIPDKNVFSKIVSVLYSADTCTNVFPSIHVFNSIGVHIAIMRSQLFKGRRIIRTASFVLMVSICLATVFLKQHSVLDGFGSFLMAYGIYYLVYGNALADAEKEIAENALS